MSEIDLIEITLPKGEIITMNKDKAMKFLVDNEELLNRIGQDATEDDIQLLYKAIN